MKAPGATGGSFSTAGVGAAFGATAVNGVVTSWLTAWTQGEQMWTDLKLKETQWAADATAIIKPPPISAH
jgi:hypothetical protein